MNVRFRSLLLAIPRRRFAASLCLCMLLASSGCIAESLEPDVGELRAGLCKPEDSNPDQDISFRKDILMGIFKRAPNMAGCTCHIPGSPRTTGLQATGLDLSSYMGVRRGGNQSGKSVVIPKDPCNSLLIQKISPAPPFGSRMPSDGPPYLTPTERTLISDWIAEGARDN